METNATAMPTLTKVGREIASGPVGPDANSQPKGVISREEAERISPEYARFAADGDWGEFAAVARACRGLRHWQRVVTYVDGQFVMARVASVGRRVRDKAGPALSVSNGESVWRVDGGRWAFPAD